MKKENMKKTRKVLRWIIIILAALVVFCGIEVWISYNWLQVTNYTIASEKIVEPMRLVLLADLHDHEFGKGNEKLVAKVAEQKPDLILMAGDFLNSYSEDVSVPVELVASLSGVAQVFYSWGNHELGYIKAHLSGGETGADVQDGSQAEPQADPEAADGNGTKPSAEDLARNALRAELEAAGAVVLDEESVNMPEKGNELLIGGMYEYAFGYDGSGNMDKSEMEEERVAFLEEFQASEKFKIMMAHRPDSFIFGQATETWDIDLVVAGHNHGGHVIVPGLGGLYGGDQGFWPKYDYGLFHFDAVKNMVITRGLGAQREKLPRFNNRPEIVVIDLVPA